MKKIGFLLSVFLFTQAVLAQKVNNFAPDFSSPPVISGMTLVWNDEFNIDGKPDPASWRYETGFVRNQELQWYQKDNANCKGGVLLIEGRREKVRNPRFVQGSQNWKDVPTILANFAWETGKRFTGKWDDLKKPLADFTAVDADWIKKFHIWRMDWDNKSIKLFLDDMLLLLNLAIGANGGDPGTAQFPIKYEIDYLRTYQKK